MKLERSIREPRAVLARRRLVFMVSALLVPVALAGQDRRKAGVDLREKADAIRASADELFKLRRVPWVTDPAEGFRLAKEENRPVFLYLQAGDPLEDC